jgi:hypothetical protein
LKVARGAFHRPGIHICQEKNDADEEKFLPGKCAICS